MSEPTPADLAHLSPEVRSRACWCSVAQGRLHLRGEDCREAERARLDNHYGYCALPPDHDGPCAPVPEDAA